MLGALRGAGEGRPKVSDYYVAIEIPECAHCQKRIDIDGLSMLSLPPVRHEGLLFCATCWGQLSCPSCGQFVAGKKIMLNGYTEAYCLPCAAEALLDDLNNTAPAATGAGGETVTAAAYRRQRSTGRVGLQAAVAQWVRTAPVVCKRCGEARRSAIGTGVCTEREFLGGAK